jgi:hypothetical protein
MNKNCLILLTVLTLACVRRPPVLYTHPSKAPASFEADKYECEVKARQILAAQYPGNALALGLYLNKEIRRCLEAHGWVPQA